MTYAGTADHPISTSVEFEIKPSCHFSPLYSTAKYFPISIVSEAIFTLDIDESKYTHFYKTKWDALYNTNICELSFRLEGDGMAFTSISGNRITAEPDKDTLLRLYDLDLVTYYSDSAFDTSLPSDTIK